MDSTKRRGPGRPPTADGPRKHTAKTRLRDDELASYHKLLKHHGYPLTESGLRAYLLEQARQLPQAA